MKPVIGAVRGLTRRELVTPSVIYPDGFKYTWTIQQQYSNGSDREWRDIPKVNAWELPADDKDYQS